MPLLQDHIAVVTGAASGIGRAIAAGFAHEGARVVLLDIDGDAAAEAAGEIRGAPIQERAIGRDQGPHRQRSSRSGRYSR